MQGSATRTRRPNPAGPNNKEAACHPCTPNSQGND